MVRSYIGLGANLNDPAAQIITALKSLHELLDVDLVRWSSLYGSTPLGPMDQPDYINAVAEINTSLPPLELLDQLQLLEQSQGRIKHRHWGERCIDLDILLYGDEVLQSERLNLPHHEMANRSFVVRPLLEIAADLVLPDGRRLDTITPAFDGNLHRLERPVIDL